MFKWNQQYIVQDDFLDDDSYNFFVEFSKQMEVLPEDQMVTRVTSYRLDSGKSRFITYGGAHIGGVTNQDARDPAIKPKPFMSDQQIEDLYYRLYPSLCNDYINLGGTERVEQFTVTLARCNPELRFQIHKDARWKKLSTVVYLAPQKSTGTILYNEQDGSGESYEVEWKPNRAFTFAPNKDTWHSYRGSPTGDRITLLINLEAGFPL